MGVLWHIIGCVYLIQRRSMLSYPIRFRPQPRQGESGAKPETPMLIILSLVCKFDIFRGNLSNPFFEKKVLAEKHPREADKCRNNISYIDHLILCKYCQTRVEDKQYPERAGHHSSSLPPFVRDTCIQLLCTVMNGYNIKPNIHQIKTNQMAYTNQSVFTFR